MNRPIGLNNRSKIPAMSIAVQLATLTKDCKSRYVSGYLLLCGLLVSAKNSLMISSSHGDPWSNKSKMSMTL